jgi:beta-lactamase regulating signal transducer with metallopeptidase domain
MTDFWARWAANVLAQVTVVVLLAALLAWPARRRPAARHAVWLSALGGVLLSPLLALVAPRIEIAVLPAERPSAAVAETPARPRRPSPPPRPDRADAPPIAVAATPPAATTPATPLPAEQPMPDGETAGPAPAAAATDVWRTGVGLALVAWLLGTLALLARLLHGLRVVTRLRHSARPLDPAALGPVAADVCAALGGVLPPVAEAAAVAVPIAAGVLHPVVLLPAGLADSLRPDQLRDVLIHEGAHLRRRDPLVGLLQRLAAALVWPHPLVHWLNRRLDRAREEVCDNHVLRHGSATAYARTLLGLAERLTAGRALPALALIDPHGRLEERIAGLLAPGRDRMTRVNRRVGLGAAGVLLAAGFVVAGVRLAAAPVPKADGPPDPSKAVVTGTVVDEAGKPVEGAIVRTLWRGAGSTPPSSQTGADGRFRLIPGRPTISHDLLLATGAGGMKQGLHRFTGEQLDATADIRVVLRPGRPLTAQVADPRGAPVSGATVVPLDKSLNPLARARTGPDGTARFTIPADAHVIQVIAAKAGVGLDYFENYRDAPHQGLDELPAEVKLVLDGVQTVRVRATDRAGRPVPGVMTLPWYIHKQGKAYHFNGTGSLFDAANIPRTGPAGVAVFDWIPAGLKTGVQFNCYAEDFYQPDMALLAPGRRDTTLDVRLLRNVRVSGRVTKPDGQPAPGILVRAEGRGGTPNYCRKYSRTAADGTYALLCYPGQSYIIAVTDNSWAAPSHIGIVLREGEPRDGLNFRLGNGTLLRGRVTVGTPPRPAAGHTITLIQQGAPTSANDSREQERLPLWATTDTDGRYQFRVGPGEYKLYAEYGGNQPPEDLTVQEDAVLIRDFHLPRLPRGPLTGMVKKTDGTPVAGAAVFGESIQAPGHAGFLATADKQGHFKTGRWRDRMALYAHSPDSTLAGSAVIGADDESATITLSPAAKATGRIVGPDGKPRAGYRFQFTLLPSGGEESQFVRFLTTDAEGRFTATGLPNGARCLIRIPANEDDSDGKWHEFVIKGTAPMQLGDYQAPAAKK